MAKRSKDIPRDEQGKLQPVPKHDYDSDEFYDKIRSAAMQGFTDAEIADTLNVDPVTFSNMKKGHYPVWDEEENARRSERITSTLEIGRRKVMSIVRGRYLKAALGGIKTKTVVKRFITEKCPCGGDPACMDCGGSGWVLSTTKAVAQETEIELPPNMQALANWLYQHDPEWRKVQRGKDEETQGVPQDIPHGIEIDAWIRKETETDEEK